MSTTIPKFVFFGSPHIAVWVLDELEQAGILPSLVVTNPDAPQGRKLVMTPTPVALWASDRGIPVLKPETLKSDEVTQTLRDSACELFIVAAYGKIIPEAILDIPKYKTVNVHPSLLPLLRGASPIRSAILEDMNPTGVSIMILTKGMDEGPLLAQEETPIPPEEWPLAGHILDERLARHGGKLLADILPRWIDGEVTPQEQDHSKATFCTKITKEMGELDLTADPYHNLLKIRAFDGWPGTYFFAERHGSRIRVKVVDAKLADDGSLCITKVIPEGKNEVDYETFVRTLN